MRDFDLPRERPVAALRVATRADLASMVDRHLAACRRSGTSLAVVCIALDGLALVGERDGAAESERWMDEAWFCVRRCTRGVDLVVRVGSDELAAILPGTSAAAAAVVQARLAAALRSPCRTGAAVYPQAGDTGHALVHAAGTDSHQLDRRCASGSAAPAFTSPSEKLVCRSLTLGSVSSVSRHSLENASRSVAITCSSNVPEPEM